MTSAQFKIDADALHAFADGQLSGEQRMAVERYLADHPETAAEVAHWRRQNEALGALFAPAAHEPVPARLSPHRIAHDIRIGRQQAIRNIAAAAVLVVLGSGIGWYGRDYMTPTVAASDRLIDAAVTAHSLYIKEKTHAVEVAADAPNLMTWLSNRIATPIDAPSLASEGFAFIGGRLLPGDPSGELPAPAAQLMYENASAQRLTLYITAALPDHKEAWQFETRDGVEAYYWANATVTCTIVGDLSEAEIRALGKKVFEQLTWRAESSWNPAG
ncbi:MAG: anti-sigma factor [Devosia nanyangense]|uniref:Anti-sigma factor n=1 Tax=Devosia nanyangense TaxID=1228055 RepID=A0A933NZX5_9HYPH|nr:anti-sigma factor [Devosia nanyangense]